MNWAFRRHAEKVPERAAFFQGKIIQECRVEAELRPRDYKSLGMSASSSSVNTGPSRQM